MIVFTFMKQYNVYIQLEYFVFLMVLLLTSCLSTWFHVSS
jgi:hypothetical protein